MKKQLLEQTALLKYSLEHIKTLIPEVEDMVEYDDSVSEPTDNPARFLTKEEYNLLTDIEKTKKHLSITKKMTKRNWEIGRDFENFIGYLFEQKKFEVEYFGIEKKFEDLGRDLIVKNSNSVFIVQCKYWSKSKLIHEKHITQLFGTMIKYRLENPTEKT
jgi:HJR/Mrr/RecB family endonuclease